MREPKINREEMIELYRSGDYSQSDLAKRYEVSPVSIHDMIIRELDREERKVIVEIYKRKKELAKLLK